MKIAVFLKYDNCAILDDDVVKAYIFNVEDELITSVGNEIILLKNVNYLMLLVVEKQINCIYSNDINDDIKSLLNNIGVDLKPMNSLKEHPILKSFLV
ncbi:hypothetical protein LJB95_03565 [Paludibacteraceae bacterium OttesenSCG-928-F17]|nr:hypothetical protein [Paludibacteraceae bacterium OttesenSCG-928-F17]